jgi:hypothetical protein
MKVIFRKGKDKYDTLICERNDGTSTWVQTPKTGVISHDQIHFFVESLLDFRYGFLGFVSRGTDIEEVHRKVHEEPESALEESLQVEAVVEVFQTEVWNGFQMADDFLENVAITCYGRGIPVPGWLTEDRVERVRAALRAFAEVWVALPVGETVELAFPDKTA